MLNSLDITGELLASSDLSVVLLAAAERATSCSFFLVDECCLVPSLHCPSSLGHIYVYLCRANFLSAKGFDCDLYGLSCLIFLDNLLVLPFQAASCCARGLLSLMIAFHV